MTILYEIITVTKAKFVWPHVTHFSIFAVYSIEYIDFVALIFHLCLQMWHCNIPQSLNTVWPSAISLSIKVYFHYSCAARYLLKMKCLPILLYSLEVCNLSKRNLQSLDFTVNRFFFMKLFNTNNMHIINVCQLNFAFELPSVHDLTKATNQVRVSN